MLRLLCLVLVAAAAAQEDGPLVVTTYGTVRGTHHEDEGYSSFTGMRYAQAPTGRNRFGSATPLNPWNGIFEANQNDISCPQVQVDTFIGSNDCLTLNVYTPDVATPENPVAVIVYFYGGAFVMGSVNIYSHEFLIKHDVVVVLANFRISALGHLCLRHELIPGNAAFKDQVAALRWVQQNIRAFGGDPDNITIMGHSAGAASVDLLTLSPMAEGLFQRSIAVSGSSQAFWAVSPDPVRYATTMAQIYLGYDGNSNEDLVEFYLNTDDEALARATTLYYLELYHSSLPVAACVEEPLPNVETFLTDSPANIIESEQYTPVPIIYIVANKEYVNMLVPWEVENAEDLMQTLETHLPNDLVFQSDQKRMDIANRVREFYVSDEKSILESYVDYKSDTMFYYNVARAARERQVLSDAPIYMLEFTYESDRRWQRLPETDGMIGAGHGDEILYSVLSTPGLPLSGTDQLTIDRYTTLLTSFSKYGNPTPDPDDLQWLPLTESQFRYLELGSEVTPLFTPHSEAIAFWDQVYSDVRPHIPLVQTEQGLVRGTHHPEDEYSSFTGIRYATAPTGRNRFTNALPPAEWEGIFDANQNDIYCPQIQSDIFIGVNDCLTLNIFTPDVATPENPIAVVVYFHGGAFIMGSISFHSHDFLIKHDVVVVMANFRISALGHLCLRHELIPGNAAFKDQVAALRWVQQNIRAFGGDPDQVTIMGHSAGGVSVDLLSLSPMAEGLFQRSIAVSGSARAFWAVNPDPIEYATTMAQTYLGYDGDSDEDLVEFYLDTDDEAVAHAVSQFRSDLHDGSLPVSACVEEALPNVESFLTDSPANIIESEQYSPVPIIYIVANKEYVNMLLPWEVENAEELMQTLETHLPNDLVFQSDQQRTDIGNRVREFYVSDEKSILESYVDFKSDTLFYFNIARAARERPVSSDAPIYMLEFTYESDRRLPRLPETDGMIGTGHGDDILYVVLSIPGQPISNADQLTIDRYTTLLTNFVKYGNPTPDSDDLQWLPLTESQFRYLELGSEVTPLVSPHSEAIAFWNQVYSDMTPHIPLVQTEQGLVRGTHHPGDEFSSFTGIRYATVPTGQDRYAAPLPPPSFDGIFDADQNNIFCPQILDNEFIGVEDCLSLNIFTPDTASPDNRKAVIVYFYGGAYMSGSKVLYGPDHLISHDVVIVIVNFRVGVLGLLCLGHELVPGNAAFKDQVAALRWIQQNIAAFSGDPDNVTIMGHSSGGASVDLLTLSPLTAGLFHRSVTVSASSQGVWTVNSNPVELAFQMAQSYLDFEGDDIEALVQLFLNTDAQTLATALTQYYTDVSLVTLPVAACVEDSFPGIDAFLTDTPANTMASGDYTSLPKIYVVTNKEYVNMVTPTEIERVNILMASLELILPKDLNIQAHQLRRSVADRVRSFYIKDEISTLESYIDYRSDTLFYYGIVRTARQRLQANEPVYLLEFAYESDLRIPRLPETDGITGVGHGDDAPFIIYPIPPGMPVTDSDRLTTARYTTLVSNFAKYGNPTPDVDDLQWPPMTSTWLRYLELGSEVLISAAPRADAIELWDQIYVEVEKPHVQTLQGLVRGTHHPDAGYSSFTGIRYATIPTGRNRYASPISPVSWDGIFVADQDNIFCPHVWNGEFVGTEDCLVLNIYTPDTASETNPLSVIVYIHGGAFVLGANTNYGPDQLLPRDVVVVTINYRLGPLGHLCLGHELIPGNAAFKDQVAALRWVRDNIAAFGGNPESVTIMGHSAGGASVDLLTLSPMTEGLFKGAIAVSGAARAHWAVAADPVAVATTMAETFMDYNGNSLEELVEFYLDANNEALAIATNLLMQEFGVVDLPFAACVEQEFENSEAFLVDTPANILASGEYTSIPVIYIVANKEYVNMISQQEINNITEIATHLGEYLPNDMIFETTGQRTEVVNRLQAFYINDETSNLEGYIDFISDSMFYYGIARSVRERQATSSSPVYVMEFAYESAILRIPRLPAVDGITGTGHGDDEVFVIARMGADVPFTPADYLTIERYSLLVSNFAKFGEPTPENEPLAWLPVTEDQLWYLELGSELIVSDSPNAAAIALWDEIYAGLVPSGASDRMLPSLLAVFLTAILFLFNLR